MRVERMKKNTFFVELTDDELSQLSDYQNQSVQTRRVYAEHFGRLFARYVNRIVQPLDSESA